jgi:hypothetical protein
MTSTIPKCVRPYSINLSKQNPTNHSRRHTATISGTKVGKSQQSYTMHSTRKLSTRIKATARHADQDGNASNTRQPPNVHLMQWTDSLQAHTQHSLSVNGQHIECSLLSPLLCINIVKLLL